MKKVLIGLLIAGIAIVGLLVAVVVVGLAKIDDIVEAAIEQGGTYATGVDTTVDTVDISLRKQTFQMSGFGMANPPGFDTPHFIAMADAGVSVNQQKTNYSSVITLATLELKGIDLYLDKGHDPSNYNAVLNSLKRFESGEGTKKPDSEQSGPRVVIDSLVIDGVDVHLANMPGVSMLAGDVAVNVPRIELQNVGADKPMSFGEVVSLVVKTVLAASVEAGGGIIPGDVLGDLSGGLGSLTSLSDLGIDAVGDFGKALNDQIGGATEQAQKAVEDVTKAGDDLKKSADDAKKAIDGAADTVKGIFGGDKKKDSP